MSMFCFQCQETAKGTGCTVRGVCGKPEEVAKLQDLLIYSLKGIAQLVRKKGLEAGDLFALNGEVLNSLFMTITNANFDDQAIEAQIRKMLALRDQLRSGDEDLPDAALFQVTDRASMLEKASGIGVLSTQDPDIRSLREMITYGLKGMAAYTEHARNIGQDDPDISAFIYEALSKLTDPSLSVDDLVALTLRTGEYGVKAMDLLDRANTSRYGHPVATRVNIGVRDRPAILITGHDLVDLEALLEQTQGTGVDVYTHGEMLPANAYSAFHKYDNLVGNYGGSWWHQLTDFVSFKGPILFTTNCIVPPRSEEVRSRIFTTGSTGYPACRHILPDAEGRKDFTEIIELAKTLPPPEELETGTVIAGYAHEEVIRQADKIVEAIRSGAIGKFFVMAGCDGRMKSREYYTDFARQLPEDTVILTAGCAKYRYNKLPLGEIGGIPRLLDSGQCNDSYSIVLIAKALQEAFGLDHINDLPVVFNIAWYEQKAVIVLLALLYLGIRNIHLGPSHPGFLSPGVRDLLVEKFGLAGIGSVEGDLELFLGA